jgi:OmpA-OmpF porin, OOP family
MTAKRIHAVSIALGISLTPFAANAQAQAGYASNHFNPSERGSHWFALDSLDFRGNGRVALGVVNDYSYRSLIAWANDGTVGSSIVRNQYLAHLGAAITLEDRFRLGLSVPLQVFADGHTGTINGRVHRPAEDVAAGDVRFSADARIVGEHGDPATVAAGVQLFLPAGTPSAYTGDGKPRILPHVLFAGRMSSFEYAANIGFMGRVRDEAFGFGYIGNAFVYGLSAGVRLADDKLLVGPELFGSTVVADGRAFDKHTTPLEALLGVHYDVGENIRLGAGVGTRVTGGYGAPVFRGLLSLEWVPGDAKPEAPPPPKEEEKPDCPKVDPYPEPAQPPPPPPAAPPPPPDPDRDHDGITNDFDACPDEAGKPDADPKKNGCPKAFLKDGAIKITDQVRFKNASAEIVPGKDSEEVLQAVLAVLQAHPDIEKLKVEGHTDDRGTPAGNKALSAARAASVAKWLVDHGIAKERLTSEGFGQERPLEPNTTEEARSKNRRVEFHVEQAGSAR